MSTHVYFFCPFMFLWKITEKFANGGNFEVNGAEFDVINGNRFIAVTINDVSVSYNDTLKCHSEELSISVRVQIVSGINFFSLCIHVCLHVYK